MLFELKKFSENIAVLCDDGRSLTYQELSDASTSITGSLRRGLTFCLCENSIGSLAGYVGLMNGGIPTVLLDGMKDAEVINGLINHYNPRYVWCPERRKDDFMAASVVASCEGYVMLQVTEKEYEIHPDVLLCLTTSGTTGSPKLVKLTERNLKSNAESIAEYLHITAKERPITSLPMYYSFGMSVINSHLVRGATILLTNKTVFQKEFLDFMVSGKATSIAGVPYTYEMMRRMRFLDRELPELKTMIQAGGKLNPVIVKEYIGKAHEKGKQFIVMYGQTEAAPRMSYLPFERAEEKYSSIGIAVPGGRFTLRDVDDNEIVQPDVDGELVYEGPNVCMGYAECIEDLAKGDENNGILHTGDVARRDADGFYYITGRMKRFVKIWGNRCNLDATEQLVKSITTSCACVGVDDKITVFVTQEGLEEQIKDYLVEKTGLNIRAFDVKVVEDIPVLPSGKLDYQKMQALL